MPDFKRKLLAEMELYRKVISGQRDGPRDSEQRLYHLWQASPQQIIVKQFKVFHANVEVNQCKTLILYTF